jgi:hypothetical protein
MYFAEITSDPHPSCHSNYIGIGARRKNGDRVYVFGECRRQIKAVRKLIMKLGRHLGLPMKDLADFRGLGMIAAENDDLIDCLSSVPDPYAGVDLRAAFVAWKRDLNITDQILHQDPSIPQLTAVSDNQEDWLLFWRCNCPVPAIRDHLAQELEEARALKAENRERLERRKADGQQTN